MVDVKQVCEVSFHRFLILIFGLKPPDVRIPFFPPLAIDTAQAVSMGFVLINQ